MNRGETVNKINQVVTKFEINVMGRGPKEIRTISIHSDVNTRTGEKRTILTINETLRMD